MSEPPPPAPPRPERGAELQLVLRAERGRGPFLLLRDGSGRLVAHALPTGQARQTVGRSEAADLALAWDDRVSRLHAELESGGGEWTVADDGLSRNGTWVNGERVVSRRRLRDGDAILVGATVLVFRAPRDGAGASTVVGAALPAVAHLTPVQREVLRALCAPLARGAGAALPAGNVEIAEAVHLSLDAVKGHLRVLYRTFGVAELAQGEKRMRLAEAALRAGLSG